MSHFTWALWVPSNSCARACSSDVMTLSTNQDFPVTPPTSAFLRHELLNAIALKSSISKGDAHLQIKLTGILSRTNRNSQAMPAYPV
uniref:Uncharacterized protein n=1 Tax=Ixodes ricinus TaxID=34613 RepID=A0A6B0TZ38_IXORI